MKQKEKSALACQRILDAALQEFSTKGYEGASLSAVCAKNGISKGIVYHHFRSKNELYLLCVEKCFDSLTSYLNTAVKSFQGTMEEELQNYFHARLRFFTENPIYLSIFIDASFQTPADLAAEIRKRRRSFEELNVSILTGLLEVAPLRSGFSVTSIAEEFQIYMDFFNLRFQTVISEDCSPETVLKQHEERCHRQIDILLHGVLGESNAN